MSSPEAASPKRVCVSPTEAPEAPLSVPVLDKTFVEGIAPCYEGQPLRKGKWCQCEAEYAMAVIEAFKLRLYPLEDGTTLRVFLAQNLHCADMRVSKKFSGGYAIGKVTYHPLSPGHIVDLGAHQSLVTHFGAKLSQLRDKLLRHLLHEGTQTPAGGSTSPPSSTCTPSPIPSPHGMLPPHGAMPYVPPMASRPLLSAPPCMPPVSGPLHMMAGAPMMHMAAPQLPRAMMPSHMMMPGPMMMPASTPMSAPMMLPPGSHPPMHYMMPHQPYMMPVPHQPYMMPAPKPTKKTTKRKTRSKTKSQAATTDLTVDAANVMLSLRAPC